MKNWKTTMFGALAAVAQIAIPAYQTGTLDGKSLIPALFMGLLGFFAKDAGVTGTEV